jgi:Domain of unknown function (DUF5666)
MKRFQLLLCMTVLPGTWSGGAMAEPASQAAAKRVDKASHQICGTIRAMKGSQLTVETREKHMVEVDTATAIKTYRSAVLAVGGAVIIQGRRDARGVLHAETIQRAKSSPANWPADQ